MSRRSSASSRAGSTLEIDVVDGGLPVGLTLGSFPSARRPEADPSPEPGWSLCPGAEVGWAHEDARDHCPDELRGSEARISPKPNARGAARQRQAVDTSTSHLGS